MASWLGHSTPEQAVRVQALAGDIVLCSWARHFTLTVPLSTQVYKWVLASLVPRPIPAIQMKRGSLELSTIARSYKAWHKMAKKSQFSGKKSQIQGRKLGPSERLGRVTFPFGQGKT